MLAEALGVPFAHHRFLGLRSQVIHCHYRYSPRFKNVFCLMRDGRDVVCSFYFYMLFDNEYRKAPLDTAAARQLGILDPEDYRANLPKFIEYVFTNRAFPRFTWNDFFYDWHDKDVAWVRYEDLLHDAAGSLSTAVARVTGAQLSPDRLLDIQERYSFISMSKRKPGEENVRRFIRKGVAGDWREKFSPEAAAVFAHYAGDTLIALGYEQDHTWVQDVVVPAVGQYLSPHDSGVQ